MPQIYILEYFELYFTLKKEQKNKQYNGKAKIKLIIQISTNNPNERRFQPFAIGKMIST